MAKKRINPEDLKLNVHDVSNSSSVYQKDTNQKNNEEPNNLSIVVCASYSEECMPTDTCVSLDCHTNDGCVHTQSGHQECCPITEEGPCPHTTDCTSVAQVCASIDVCLVTENMCAQTFDCFLESNACEIATDNGSPCLETINNGFCEKPIQTIIGNECDDETRTCGE